MAAGTLALRMFGDRLLDGLAARGREKAGAALEARYRRSLNAYCRAALGDRAAAARAAACALHDARQTNHDDYRVRLFRAAVDAVRRADRGGPCASRDALLLRHAADLDLDDLAVCLRVPEATAKELLVGARVALAEGRLTISAPAGQRPLVPKSGRSRTPHARRTASKRT